MWTYTWRHSGSNGWWCSLCIERSENWIQRKWRKGNQVGEKGQIGEIIEGRKEGKKETGVRNWSSLVWLHGVWGWDLAFYCKRGEPHGQGKVKPKGKALWEEVMGSVNRVLGHGVLERRKVSSSFFYLLQQKNKIK